MADRYWVGGTATWDATAGLKWSATSGGSGGATVPTAADDVFFDAASGTVTCTISGARVAKSINCTGFTGTLGGTSTPSLTISGSLTLSAGMTVTYSGTTTFNATGTITSAGKTLGSVTINGSGITVTLGDALTTSTTGILTVTAGTFDTANYNVTVGALSSSGSSVRSILLGSSTVTLGSTGTVFDTATNTNLTFNAGTSTIIVNNSGPTIAAGTQGNPGVTFYNISLARPTIGTTFNIQGINTFNDFSVTGASSGLTEVTFNSRQTINGLFRTTGTNGRLRVWFRSSNYGTGHTLTINGTTSLADADFRDIYVVGTAAPIGGTRIGNRGNATGITFSTPKTVYWVTTTGGNWSTNSWSDTPGGSSSTAFFPLPQDTAVIGNTGLNSGATITLDSALGYICNLDLSTRTVAATINISANQFVYGSWTTGSGITLSGTATLTFSGGSEQTITSAGKAFSCPMVVDSYGGVVKLADALALGAGDYNLTVTHGTFNTQGYSVTCANLVSGSGGDHVRSILLGSSTVTAAGSTGVGFTNVTRFTFDAGTSQINLSSPSAISFTGGGLTFYNVSFTSASTANRTINGANTFNNLTVTPPSTAGILSFILTADQVVNGTFSVQGTTGVRRIFVRSDINQTQRTISANTLSSVDCDFRDINLTGTAAGTSPTRAGNCGGNLGITFPAPKTVQRNGNGSWSSFDWIIGGLASTENFPLAQDTITFNDTGNIAYTVTIDAAWNIGTVDFSTMTQSNYTITLSATSCTIYGSWIGASSRYSISTTSNTFFFGGRSTQTFTPAGVSWNCPIDIDGGNVVLGGALQLGNTRLFRLTAGSFDAVSYNVTCGSFLVADTNFLRRLKMGSGTWTLASTGTVWSIVGTTNLAFYKGTANILLSSTSTAAREFTGGGLCYNKLTIGGASGISTLTITFDNQFEELASIKTVAHTIALGTTAQRFGKWTVTGTVGNVVTLTGTGTNHVLAGPCTSGIDYLSMGSIGFSATSRGEFYAGANSTGTASAPVYRTAKPADSTRYWVGGTGNWSDTSRWSTSSGGGSGASVPRSHDDAVFDSASNATSYTSTVNVTSRCKSLTISGPAAGSVTLAGTSTLIIHGSLTLPATGLTRTFTGPIVFSGATTGNSITTNGVALSSTATFDGVGASWTLGSALSIGTTTLSVINGTLNCASYNLTASTLTTVLVNGWSSFRAIDLGSSTVTLSLASGAVVDFGQVELERSRASLTFTAGTSQINLTASGNIQIAGNDQTFNNVSFTSGTGGITFLGTNTFNNLTFAGGTSVGVRIVDAQQDQTITGALTFSAGTNATTRQQLRSSSIGQTRTFSCASFSGVDVDFRDITITGAAAPISGTRLGDCKGNSGITFDTPKTVYWNRAGGLGGNWSQADSWATSSGGTPATNNFPLAQDTAVINNTAPSSASSIVLDSAWNIGTIDMSSRTSTVTLNTSSGFRNIHGNWTNGSGVTVSSSLGTLVFQGRGSQTITTAGKAFPCTFRIDSPGGTVTLQDALTLNTVTSTALDLYRGTFDTGSFNVTITGTVSLQGSTDTRALNMGSSTIVVGGSGTSAWAAATGSSTLTISGSGTINLTSASAKTFAGGSKPYTDITLNQGGNGALTISGNNTFKTISSTATGATSILLASTTQRITTSWTATGTLANPLTISGTFPDTPAILIYTGSGTAADVDYLILSGIRAYNITNTWLTTTNSINNGSVGWVFNTPTAPVSSTSNFFFFFPM